MYNRGFDDAQALSSSPEQCTSGKHGHSYLPVAEGWGELLTPAEPPTPPFSAPPVGRRCASLEVSSFGLPVLRRRTCGRAAVDHRMHRVTEINGYVACRPGHADDPALVPP